MKTVVLLFAAGCAAKGSGGYSAESPAGSTYVFGWPYVDSESMTVRGGTSTGAPVQLISTPDERWVALQDASPTDKDAAAIRALTGTYRVSFEFLESVVFGGATTPAKPYRSWGTEKVYLIEEAPGFVSLQHVLSMTIITEEGETMGPIVMKHWRQDWQNEPQALHEFNGLSQWSSVAVAPVQRQGAWSQTVYQVDDSPRYSMIGSWNHTASSSMWQSEPAWRPLPRREYSVRDDYNVMGGTHRIEVLPTGWVHTQDNTKEVLTAPGTRDPTGHLVAREMGIARYERIDDSDFGPADEYWSTTGDFWAAVRAEWETVKSSASTLTIDKECDGTKLWEVMFTLAGQVETGEVSTADAIASIPPSVACVTEVVTSNMPVDDSVAAEIADDASEGL